ncbi:MAG: hypothetical protein ABIP94_08115 [Planctomycetota bacterium]
MDLGQFLLSLQGAGRVQVARDAMPQPGAVDQVLRDFDAAVRIDGPADLPALELAPAVWAAERLFAACALFAHRDLGVDAVTQRLGVPCPARPDSPSAHYSADLALRHLPDLCQLARGVAPDDPLLVRLRQLAQQWPLSSVGMVGLGSVDAGPVLAHPALTRVYVDRILRCNDQSRTSDPRVVRAIEAAIGEHRQFAEGVLAVHDQLCRRAPPP